MMKKLLKELAISTAATLVLAVLVGGIYPVAVWAAAQLFPQRAGGSLIEKEGKVVGSELIGQNFTSDRYFLPRPSAAGNGYDATSSGGSNLGPLSKKLLDGVKDRAIEYRKRNGMKEDAVVPADAVLASGSGLDPHISVANAQLQVSRVARVRGMREEIVRHFVEQFSEGRELGLLGEPRVNVLLLNLALDQHPGNPEPKTEGR
jgi:K+-transporting ATPase ATPase C chain